MPFRGLTMLKSPKLIIKGGLCYGFAMVNESYDGLHILMIYTSEEPLAASSSNPRDIQLVVHLFSSQHTGSYTAQHYLKFKVCRRIW